ncbi:MAG: FeS assembly SUF system protein [Candidatus Hydrogenedentes bacterium CG1_02_42_14]|nr:MAG: FeS assembly SUF system protein [Candidatus Hydrogenedentes bacterium CG1_02_42_14]
MKELDSAPALCPSGAKHEELKKKIIEVLKKIYDPEIPVNIYDLGLIYEIEVEPSGTAVITMTLTSPNCPVAQSLSDEVKEKVEKIEGIGSAFVELVWEPPWDPYKMSESAKIVLNMI